MPPRLPLPRTLAKATTMSAPWKRRDHREAAALNARAQKKGMTATMKDWS